MQCKLLSNITLVFTSCVQIPPRSNLPFIFSGSIIKLCQLSTGINIIDLAPSSKTEINIFGQEKYHQNRCCEQHYILLFNQHKNLPLLSFSIIINIIIPGDVMQCFPHLYNKPHVYTSRSTLYIWRSFNAVMLVQVGWWWETLKLEINELFVTSPLIVLSHNYIRSCRCLFSTFSYAWWHFLYRHG